MYKKTTAKKAQNFIEIALLAGVLVLITISVVTIYNNQSLKTAKMTNINVTNGAHNGSSVNLNTMTADDSGQKIPYNNANVDTAGALSLVGLSQSDYNSAMSNITYGQVKNSIDQSKSDGEKDILTLANTLDPNAKLDSSNVSDSTLETLNDILNSIPTDASKQTQDQKDFVARYDALLSSAK